jgi:TolA-binding protein
LAKANVELSQNKIQEAIDILLNMVDSYSGTKSASTGIYLLAKAYYEKGDYDKSLVHFENYLDDYGDDDILASASYSGIGSCYEQLGKYLEAAQNYENGAKKFPTHFNAAQQLIDAGRCYSLQNQIAQAKACYKLIIEKYPDNNLKNDAELYLAKLSG